MTKKEKTPTPTKPKKKSILNRKIIHEVDETNDIKFRGPLSYRHLRIFGWAFLFIAQVGLVIGIATKTGIGPDLTALSEVLKYFSSLMAPLFLIAAFSQVIIAKNGYKRLIFTYVGAAIGLFLLFLFVYLHYIVGIISAMTGGDAEAQKSAELIIALFSREGFFTFNVFIDLALCTLLTFFINYKPTKFFQGKLIYLFRSFVALPILYEIASVTIKILVSLSIFNLHPLVYPLLTTKPPFAFAIFVILALFVKTRERFFIKKGKTHDDFVRFQDTNVNRLQFSLALIKAIVLAAVVDLLVFIVFLILFAMNAPSAEVVELQRYLTVAMQNILAWGIGKTVPMLLIIPIVVFFDYRREYKNKMVDIIIPVAGIGLIALLYIEGLFEIFRYQLFKMFNETKDVDESTDPVSKIAHKFIDFCRK